MDRSERGKCELTNIVAVIDKKENRILVENRVKGWCGIAFPGGHIEEGETFYESAVREVKEETGLDVFNLKLCGISHWHEKRTGNRFIVVCYVTYDFSGTLINSEEGNILWMDIDDFKRSDKLSPNLSEQLDLFFDDKVSEVLFEYEEGKPPIMKMI